MYASPERLRIVPSRAPASHAAAASRRVGVGAARSFPRRTSPIASCRHCFAAASICTVFSVRTLKAATVDDQEFDDDENAVDDDDDDDDTTRLEKAMVRLQKAEAVGGLAVLMLLKPHTVFEQIQPASLSFYC